MDTHDLEFLIHSLDECAETTNEKYKQLLKDHAAAYVNPDIMLNRFAEIYGGLAGELLYIKRRLQEEIEDTQNRKKFYQFWKK